jgi:competence protein ComEC
MLHVPLFAIGFVLGVLCVQRSAALIASNQLVYLTALLAIVCLIFAIFSSVKPNRFDASQNQSAILSASKFKLFDFSSLKSIILILIFTLIAFGIGFLWATLNAKTRMQHMLPKVLEQVPIELEGTVVSEPKSTQYGWRVLIDIQKVHAPVEAQEAFQNGRFPKRVSLNYYPLQSYSGAKALALSQEKYKQEKYKKDTTSMKLMVGEQWRLTTSLKRLHSTINPHGFDFEAWAISEKLNATGTIKTKQPMDKLASFVWQPRYMVEFVRVTIQHYIAQALESKPHRGLVQALVMGDQSQITQEDWQVMLNTGTTHLMSISGLHISLLAGLVFAISHFCWRRVPALVLRLPARKAATFAAVMTALCYALIAGFAVPTQRALCMLLVFAVALWTGRQFVISQVLAIALIVVIIIDPWAVISAGFWLSFGAVACLAFVFTGRVAKLSWHRAFLSSQWAITLGLLPLLLILFNQVSIISPIANALAIPLISFVVAPLALIGGFLQLDFLLTLSHYFIHIGILCLGWLSHQSIAVWQQQAPPIWTLLPAICGAIWLLLPKGFPMKWLGLVGFLPIFTIFPARPDIGAMKVTVLDVSQGLSVVVQTHSRTLLYDTGNMYNAQSDAGKSVIIPFLRAKGISRLDGVMVSHHDTDHTGGLASLLASMPISWLSASFDATPYVMSLNTQPAVFNCLAGQKWGWDKVDFEVLYPTQLVYEQNAYSTNDQSCVLRITSQHGSILLTGDIEKHAELAILNHEYARERLRSDVLVAPHHGSKTSSRSDFIQAVSPSTTIFTVGYLNRYRHPHHEITARYLQENIAMYRSDYHGGLTLDFNQPSHITLSSARKEHRRYWHQSFAP